jgi:c-di-GMP-binding flagellar brake protein YcgR
MDEATFHTLDRPSAAALPAVDLSWLTNHREHPRIAAHLRLDNDMTIADPHGRTQWSASLLNVSAGGISAICDRELMLDGGYGVRFPLELQGAAEMVKARMKVVYCIQQEDLGGYRIGFQLLRPES